MPLAIGAVVVGVPSTFHTPLSGQVSPVLARVPMGARLRFKVFAANMAVFLFVRVENKPRKEYTGYVQLRDHHPHGVCDLDSGCTELNPSSSLFLCFDFLILLFLVVVNSILESGMALSIPKFLISPLTHSRQHHQKWNLFESLSYFYT